MKLAFVLFEYFPYGGLQRDMLAIAETATARGHAVTVLTRVWHGEPPRGPKLERVAVRGASNHARDAAFARAIQGRVSGFDRVVGFNKMPGLDWYYGADGCLAERYRGVKRWLPRYRSKLAMETAVFSADVATGVLSISPCQRTLYQKHYGTPDARFVNLPPGIRRDRLLPEDFRLRRARLRTELGVAETTPMLLFIGSGFRTKGLDRAIRALAALPDDVRLFVVGDDDAGPYERLAQRSRVASRVRFMGGQSNIPDWLWSADLLMHPAYAENTGTVLLEATIAGLPVLTTSACGYAGYVRDANMGTVLDDPGPDRLAAAAAKLLAQPRDRWRERGLAFASGVDIYDLVEHAVDAIEVMPGTLPGQSPARERKEP